MKIFYVDGKFVPAEHAVIPVDDLSVLRGFGVCDLIRTYNGEPFFLKAHVERLENSARKIDLRIPWSRIEMEKIILETLKQNPQVDEANIRVVITGGSSTDFITPQGNPRLLVLITEIPELPREWYEKGVKIISVFSERNIPDAKSLSYVTAAVALKEAKKRNAMEALYVNRDGFAAECTTSNLFVFIDNTLITPDKGVLKGITRQVILSLSSGMFKQKLQPIHMDELLKADEVFISGTNKGVVPVVKIDDTVIADGRPGKNTKKIIKALKAHTRKSKGL